MIAILLCSLSAFAQKDSLSKSLIEKLSDKSGSLFKREFTEIGKIKGMKVDLLRITNLSEANAKSFSGARFENSTQYSDYIAFVDADELDGLIASLQYIQTKIFNDTAKVYTEVEFKTRGGFKAGCYFTPDDKKWSGFVQVASYSNKSMIFMDSDDFRKFKGMMEQVKSMIK